MKTSVITLSALALATSLSASPSHPDNVKKSLLVARAPELTSLATTPPSTTSQPIPGDSPAVEQLFVEAGTAIDNSTQDSHAGLSALGDRVTAGVKNQVNTWKSQGYTAPLTNDEELSRALLDFNQKLSSLNLADESTWTSVKSDTTSSVQHLQGVFGDLRAASAKKK